MEFSTSKNNSPRRPLRQTRYSYHFTVVLYQLSLLPSSIFLSSKEVITPATQRIILSFTELICDHIYLLFTLFLFQLVIISPFHDIRLEGRRLLISFAHLLYYLMYGSFRFNMLYHRSSRRTSSCTPWHIFSHLLMFIGLELCSSF